MKKTLAGFLLLMIFSFMAEAQTRYIISFTDKGDNPYSLNNPSAFLSQASIERRNFFQIAYDSTDLPVTPRYIDSIQSAGTVTILNISKWLNSVSIQTTDDEALARISSFPFVQSVTGIAAKTNSPGHAGKFPGQSNHLMPDSRFAGMQDNLLDYGSSLEQVSLHNGQFLHNIGLRGEGMTIGMLDAGFRNYLSVDALDSANLQGRILSVFDFVTGDSSVNEDHQHGMQCLSVIAANIPGEFVGSAPKANFHLFRSEDAATEYPIELHNWVCAAERLDSLGGNIISSSLGYNTFDVPYQHFDYSHDDMDGNTTMAAIGADLAAKKGILVINSAGNEGGNSWGKIITPADGDSVLAVGAVWADSVAAGFTSRGPSADGRIKPDVASMGVNTTVQFPNNAIGTSNGTSFAAPNMAGLATCLWQGFPEANNYQVIQALRYAGHRADNPNDTVGYGIPDMKKAMLYLLKLFATSGGSISNCKSQLIWQSRDIRGMKYEIERRFAGQNHYLKIAEVQAVGNEFSMQSYLFEEDLNNLPSGNISYRIRQVIDTAAAGFAADYIDTVELNHSNNCVTSGSITLMPNPTSGPLTIRVSSLEAIPGLVIKIYSSAGQLVHESKRNHQQGAAFYSIPVQHYASGLYYVVVYSENEKLSTLEFLKIN